MNAAKAKTQPDDDIIDLTDIIEAKPATASTAPKGTAPKVPDLGEQLDDLFGNDAVANIAPDVDADIDALLSQMDTEPSPAVATQPYPDNSLVNPNEHLTMPSMDEVDSLLDSLDVPATPAPAPAPVPPVAPAPLAASAAPKATVSPATVSSDPFDDLDALLDLPPADSTAQHTAAPNIEELEQFDALLATEKAPVPDTPLGGDNAEIDESFALAVKARMDEGPEAPEVVSLDEDLEALDALLGVSSPGIDTADNDPLQVVAIDTAPPDISDTVPDDTLLASLDLLLETPASHTPIPQKDLPVDTADMASYAHSEIQRAAQELLDESVMLEATVDDADTSAWMQSLDEELGENTSNAATDSMYIEMESRISTLEARIETMENQWAEKIEHAAIVAAVKIIREEIAALLAE